MRYGAPASVGPRATNSCSCFGTSLELAHTLGIRLDEIYETLNFFEPGAPQAEKPAASLPEVFEMLFDVITTLILFLCFGVLSRLIRAQRGNVLDYVSKEIRTGGIVPSR